MSEPRKLCHDCASFMIEVLEQRIRGILRVNKEEIEFQRSRGVDVDYDADMGQSHCFHLMELQSIVRGEKTCGVFDDFGDPPTITGPLFEERA